MASILVLARQRVKADTIALILEFSGHACEVADSVSDGLESLDRGSFDAVVAASMPRSSLQSLAKHLRERNRRTALVILPSASEQSEATIRKLLQTLSAIRRRKPAARHVPARRVAAKITAA